MNESICIIFNKIVAVRYLFLEKVYNSITEVSTINNGTTKITTSEDRSNKDSICKIGFIENLLGQYRKYIVLLNRGESASFR